MGVNMGFDSTEAHVYTHHITSHTHTRHSMSKCQHNDLVTTCNLVGGQGHHAPFYYQNCLALQIAYKVHDTTANLDHPQALLFNSAKLISMEYEMLSFTMTSFQSTRGHAVVWWEHTDGRIAN